MGTLNKVLERIEKDYRGKQGMICLGCLFSKLSLNSLNEFAEKNNIKINQGTKTKTGYLEDFAVHFYDEFESNEEHKEKYPTSLDYMGDIILKDENLKKYLSEFDFYSKQELIDVFSDFCADLEINVYDVREIPDYLLDLYLIRRTPLLRTEAVFVKTGAEMEEEKYEETLNLIQEASKVADWMIFVTTPAGVYKVGLKKLIEDTKKLKVWLYVCNPLHQKIYGITKGKKLKDFDEDVRDAYIQKLPREPIRAPSKVVKISKYDFKESESYKSKNFYSFEFLPSEQELERIRASRKKDPRCEKIFKTLLIIENEAGLPLFSHSGELSEQDDSLISGFLQAIDSFVSELGGPSSLKEINYKGFYVQGANTDLIRAALFLTAASDKILKERLEFFIKEFEKRYLKYIVYFKNTGDAKFFVGNQEIVSMVKEFLDI